MAYQRIYDSTWGRRTPFFYPPEPPGTLIVSDGVGGVQSVANQQPALDSRLNTLEGANLDPRVTALENAGFISSPFNPAPLVLQPDPVFPGRVGLNRSNPGFALDIQNLPGDQTTTLRLRNNEPGSSVNLDLRALNPTTNKRASIGTQSNHPLEFKTNNTKRMALTAAGDLEIDNNATVGGTLTVQGNVTVDDASLTLTKSGETATLQVFNGTLDFIVDNTLRAVLTQNGDFGINMATPTERLHVDGNARITGNVSIEGTGTVGIPNTVDGTAGPLIALTRLALEFDPFVRPNTAGYETITMNHNIADISKIRNISGTALITSTIADTPVLSAHPLLHFDNGVDVFISDVTATQISAAIWRELSAGTAQTVLVRVIIDIEA